MEFSVDEFLQSINLGKKLKAEIEADYTYLRMKYGCNLANDTLGKFILSNRYGSIFDFRLAIAFKKWCNKKLEDYYASSAPTSRQYVHCSIGNTEVL